MAETAKWYVVHTYSWYEKKVATNIEKTVDNRNLHDLICEVKIPTEKVVVVDDEKQREVERNIFPGYVLVKMVMNDDSWYVVRNTRGVTGFVGPGSKPVPLSEEEVERLGVESKQLEVSYKAGDAVSIIGGPLEGFSGRVESIDLPNNVVKVIVSMFGRETAVELALSQVRAAE